MGRTVSVKLGADVSQYISNIQRAKAATVDFSGQLDKAAKAGRLDTVAKGAGIAGIALGGMAAYAIKSAADFDKAMSAVSAATHANVADIGKLREAALAAGKDTQYSATQAADGITELSKAGVSTADVLNGGLKGALSLAAAGQLSVGEAAETAASAMTQFKLTGDKIPHVADLLAAGAGKAQGSVHDMGMALNQSGLVAAQFGLSIEDTTGVLAEFAHAGLLGSDAGTSLKTMLLAIANPSKQTRSLMNELGISFYDAQGKFIGLSGVAQVLQTRLSGLTEAQRQQALGQLFGNDAIRSASILYTDGAKGVAEWKNNVNAAGYASETAAKLTDNLAGDIERLKGSMETLAIQSGSGANSGIRVLVKGVNDLVNGFLSLPAPVSSTITVLAGLSGGALLLGAGWVKLRKTTADMRLELEAMGPTGTRVAAGMSKMTAAAGKVGVAFAALQVAGAVIHHFQADLNPQIEALGVGLEQYAASGKLAGEASRLLGGDLADLKTGFKFLADDSGRSQTVKALQTGLEAVVPGLDGMNTSLAKTKERITATDAALAQLVQGGNAGTAQQAFAKLASQLAVGDVSMEEFRKQFPQYAAAVEVAGNASKTAANKTGDLSSALKVGADAQNKYATEADAVAGAARGERAALGALYSQLKAQTDPVFALIDAQQKLKDAQNEAAKAVKSHGRNSEQARAADLELAKAALGLQNATGNLSNQFTGKLDPAFAATLRAAGLTEAQIKDVTKQFQQAKQSADKYTGKYEAKASAPGATKAKAELDLAYTAANHFAGPYQANASAPGATKAKAELDKAHTSAATFAGWYKANVTVTGVPSVRSQLQNLLIMQQALKKGVPASAIAATNKNIAQGFADGGWTGPGSKYQPAGVVHADEFVIQKESRQKIEAKAPGLLQEMNATGQVPGYARGGPVVDWPFRTTSAMTHIPSRAEAARAVTPDFGRWPSSPGAQRGDSGVWRSILALVKSSGIPYQFGNAYRPGDPKWHGSGRAIDFMGYNQDRLAQFFLARQSKVLELIHRTNSRDYGITRGHYNAMPHQWPLHRNHLHIAMKAGGTITEPITGVGASGRTYSFGENYQPERVVPNWQSSPAGRSVTVNLSFSGPVGSQYELQNWLVGAFDDLKSRGRI